MLKDVAVLIKYDIAILVVLINKVLAIVLVNRYSLVLQVSNELLDVADVVTEAEQLDDVFVLASDVDHFLGEVFADPGEDVELFSRELKEELQSTYFSVLVDLVLLLIADFLQHLIIHFLQLLQHLMEGRALLWVIGKHVIGEVLPVGMKLAVILHPPLSDFVQMPLILEILEGLNRVIATLTFWKRTFCMSIS